MCAEKVPSDVIVLDDDDDCDVIDLVSKEMRGNSKCINYACKSGDNMINAPTFCLSYYRVRKKHRKRCTVCMDCYNSALQFYDDMAVRLESGEKLVNVDIPFRDDLVEIDDSDDDEDQACSEEKLSQMDIEMVDAEVDDIINQLIDKFDIPGQQAALDKKLVEDNDVFSAQLKEHCDVLKGLRNELDAMCTGLYSKFTYEYRELPAIDIDDQEAQKEPSNNVDSNNDVIIVEEPRDLPKTGIYVKPALKIGDVFYAAHSNVVGCPWMKVTLHKIISPNYKPTYEVMPVNKKLKQKQWVKFVIGKDLAYSSPAQVKLTVGTRVIAVFTYTTVDTNKQFFYAGIVAECPTALNNYRYLIFFDDGYAHYVQYNLVYPIVESSKEVWDDINGESKTFIKKYLASYPDRPMVKFKKHQKVSTEYNGSWWTTTVLNIDCSLVQVSFDLMERREWIYRGSTRLRPLYNEEQAAANRLQNNKRTPKLMPKTSNSAPYVQYVNDENVLSQQPQKAVARKSTVSREHNLQNKVNECVDKDFKRSKIVYYTPKRQKPNTQIYEPHRCGPMCRELISYNLKRLVAYNPLAKPLLCGFHRLMYRYRNKRHVVYKAPCGRILRNMPELHHYLRLTQSSLTVDFFNFEIHIRCLAEFYLDDDIQPLNKDLSSGQEEVPITVMNYVDNELIDFCNYSTKREPMEGVNLNLDPNFLCGCDCEDDCIDKTKCSCWKLTLEGMKYLQQGNNYDKIGYQYRRLMEPVHTGIYECNSRCRCKATCLNRVVQNPLQHKLQVFKTANRGWGIRCINDIPQGAFICIYAGALLTEQMANEGGQCYGDEYFAELDYIEVVEKMKDDYEAEVVEDKDMKKSRHNSESEASGHSSESDEDDKKKAKDYEYDKEFVPIDKKKIMNELVKSARVSLRIRDKNSSEEDPLNQQSNADDTVTISDDEEDVVREPSSFNAKANVKLDESETDCNSIRLLFGKDENVYIMDAKSTGNIGRFLNHSCSPNVFVQNVFVDTHDLRFPWVAFFAMTYIRAGTELTWNYQYDVGSVPGKILECRCNSSECKGRLL